MPERLDNSPPASLEHLHAQVTEISEWLQSVEQTPWLLVVRDSHETQREEENDATTQSGDLEKVVATTCSRVAADARSYARSLPAWQEGQLAIEECLTMFDELRNGTRVGYDLAMHELEIASAGAESTYEGSGRFILTLALLPEILQLAEWQMYNQDPLTELRTDVFDAYSRVVPVKMIHDAIYALGLDGPNRDVLLAFLRLGIGVPTPPDMQS